MKYYIKDLYIWILNTGPKNIDNTYVLYHRPGDHVHFMLSGTKAKEGYNIQGLINNLPLLDKKG